MATDPSVQIWIKAFANFGKALAEAGESVKRLLNSTAHSPQAHAAITDELTACVLGARKRPELEGDFEPEDLA